MNNEPMTDEPKSRSFSIIMLASVALLSLVVGAYFVRHRAIAPANNISANSDAQKAQNIAGMSADQRKATEAIVRAYILEHPEIISEAAEILQQREQAKRLSDSADSISKAFPGAVAGNPNGDVTMVEFTDYNCGYCRASVSDVEKLLADDKGIKLVYREIPILAPSSRDAALWALAAAQQGKHQAFHKAMFSGGHPDAQTIRAAASAAGMDLNAGAAYAASPEAKAELDNNIKIAQKSGFSGTPTFVIGEQVIEGAQGYDALKAAIAKARKS